VAVYYAGLGLILVGWLVQVILALRKRDRTLSPWLIGGYGAGLLLLVIGNFTAGDATSAVLNLVVLALVVITGIAFGLKR